MIRQVWNFIVETFAMVIGAVVGGAFVLALYLISNVIVWGQYASTVPLESHPLVFIVYSASMVFGAAAYYSYVRLTYKQQSMLHSVSGLIARGSFVGGLVGCAISFFFSYFAAREQVVNMLVSGYIGFLLGALIGVAAILYETLDKLYDRAIAEHKKAQK